MFSGGNKPATYFTHIRYDLLPYIPRHERGRLLEAGCASGNTLCHLKKEGYAAEVYGTDLESIPDSNQQSTLINQFIQADLSDLSLPFAAAFFDTLICADILEHLKDPWTTLRYLGTLLKPGGILITSIPNIRNEQVILPLLLKGRFTYGNSGVLDRTHLRFFCLPEMRELVEQAGFQIELVRPSFVTCPLQPKRKFINRLSFGVFSDFLAQQYIIKAVKMP